MAPDQTHHKGCAVQVPLGEVLGMKGPGCHTAIFKSFPC